MSAAEVEAPAATPAGRPVAAVAAAPARVAGWARRQADVYRSRTDEHRPIGGYLGAMAAYGTAVAAARGVAALLHRPAPERVTPWDVALLGLATHKTARTIAKDAVTSPIRAPFTVYSRPSGDAELAEEVRTDSTVRHSVGELITCPFCLAQWISTAFVAGWVIAPRATRVAATTMATVAVSDWLQLGYAALQRQAEG